MFFNNRINAGQQLAQVLQQYKGKHDILILGLPRGGVVVASEVAHALEAPLDIVVTRKIGAPNNPEFAIGAIDETGEGYFDQGSIAMTGASQQYLETTIAYEQKEAQRRLALYRKGRAPLYIKNKIAILVDDGIATGATMFAAIALCRKKGAQKIIIAVPVGQEDIIARLKEMVDGVVCLHIPQHFDAVGKFYQEFGQTTDEEVIKILNSHYAS